VTTPAADTSAAPANNPEHELCERWARWVVTRKFYGPPPLNSNLLARLTAKTRAFAVDGGVDADCSRYLWHLNLCISGKDMGAERIAFELFYRHRIKNVKSAVNELGISRKTFYARVERFRSQVVREAGRMLQQAE
jgi:hypothetical protein